MSDYFKFHKNEKENSHYFLCEELLVPRTNCCDSQRLNLFSNHINQLVHLTDPEFPKVFTNFENQIGEYSIAYKKAEDDFVIIDKIIKNKFNYDLIIQYKKTGVFDIIHFRTGRTITESYGYRMDDCIPEAKSGDEIKKDSFLYKAPNYDNDGNFMYGTNLKAVYGMWFGKTFEDGLVLSETAAKKLTSFKVETEMFSINTNDVLLNLYGDAYSYKSFPKVGDYAKNSILIASRRRDKLSILYDFQEKHLREIDPTEDEVFYTSGGLVTDINIYCNVPYEIMKTRQDDFSKEIFEVYENNYKYWKEMKAALEKIIPKRVLSPHEAREEQGEAGFLIDHPVLNSENPNKYTDEIGYYWKLAHEVLDENIKWRYDGKAFDNFKIEFQLVKENPLVCGSKVTGRYGNKGVVSEIKPDEEMPTTEDGIHAEICLNALGVINRLNIAQIQEQHINFMSDHVIKLLKEKETLKEKEELFFDYLGALNKEEAGFLKKEYNKYTIKEKEDFFKDIFEKGIFIHQAPYFGNTTFDEFKKIMVEHPEWCSKYKFKNIEKELVMGDLYFIRLKHEPQNKSSMRSATNLNTKNLPSKSTLKREKKILYSTNPLKLGEMEVNNLLLTKDGAAVSKLLKCYSTSQTAREETITQLMNPPFSEEEKKEDVFNMDLQIHNERSISRGILEKYLNFLELGIKEEDDFDI